MIEVIKSKLESMSYDIKYYVNTYASVNVTTLFDDELEELIEIRGRIKTLQYKIQQKIDDKSNGTSK